MGLPVNSNRRWTGAHSFPEFDLLRLKALRSLHIAIWVGEYSLEDSHRHTIVTRVYLTITSLVFSELVVVLRARATSYLLQEVALFEALRAMTRVRPFKLVFLLEAEDCIRGEAQRMLVGALESVIAKGLLDFLDSPPTVRLA